MEVTMRSIDLKDYADHDLKIPSGLLCATRLQNSHEKIKLIFASWIDLGMAFFTTLLLSFLFSESSRIFMQYLRLRPATNIDPIATSLIFAILLWSNFFFSFLLNQGQSFGFFTVNKRLLMPQNNFSGVLKWSLIASANCLSGGLGLWSLNCSTKIVSQDHLYVDLMNSIDVTSVCLIDRIEKQKDVIHFYQEAA